MLGAARALSEPAQTGPVTVSQSGRVSRRVKHDLRPIRYMGQAEQVTQLVFEEDSKALGSAEAGPVHGGVLYVEHDLAAYVDES
ncbi:hypothetical protein GCM10009721_39270 [Terrabacter tumescens]|uniref:Uncharacterized protein n=1 Tax=Terrabacter tumescens TaxID=60443 RepID=A0ABQ2IGK4_9MICO|nr:hypothetical protein GCM10009721_39270 [Terrabacter tumescens]